MTKMAAIMGEEVVETGDFVVNEKDKIVNLTEQGVKKVEKFFNIENLADPENLEIQHNIILALRAHNLMHKDQDYVCLLYTSKRQRKVRLIRAVIQLIFFIVAPALFSTAFAGVKSIFQAIAAGQPVTWNSVLDVTGALLQLIHGIPQ